LDNVQSWFFALEKTWILSWMMVVYGILKYPIKENVLLYVLWMSLDLVNSLLHKELLSGAQYSEIALLIYIVNTIIGCLIIIKFRNINPYLLLLIISVLEYISFAMRVMYR